MVDMLFFLLKARLKSGAVCYYPFFCLPAFQRFHSGPIRYVIKAHIAL